MRPSPPPEPARLLSQPACIAPGLRSGLRWLKRSASVQVVALPYPLPMVIIPLTYPLRVPLTLKAWEDLSVRGSYTPRSHVPSAMLVTRDA